MGPEPHTGCLTLEGSPVTPALAQLEPRKLCTHREWGLVSVSPQALGSRVPSSARGHQLSGGLWSGEGVPQACEEAFPSMLCPGTFGGS